jgi:hypothetical protein
MTITPVKAVDLCHAIYAPITPGMFARTWSFGGINVGYALIDGCATFTFAGSECTRDWLRDFKAIPFTHPTLGTLHLGFWEGMEGVLDELRPYFTDDVPVSIQGHSLGCAHAAIFAGLCAKNGLRVDQLCLFAPPRTSYQTLRDILDVHVGQILAFRNGFDPVPEVPFAIPLIEPWVDIADLITLTEWPEDRYDVFAYHDIKLYQAGIAKRYPVFVTT